MTHILPVLGLIVFLGSLWLPFVGVGGLRSADLPTQPPPTPMDEPVITPRIGPTATATDTPQPTPTPTDTPQPTSTVPSALTPEPQPSRP